MAVEAARAGVVDLHSEVAGLDHHERRCPIVLVEEEAQAVLVGPGEQAPDRTQALP